MEYHLSNLSQGVLETRSIDKTTPVNSLDFIKDLILSRFILDLIDYGKNQWLHHWKAALLVSHALESFYNISRPKERKGASRELVCNMNDLRVQLFSTLIIIIAANILQLDRLGSLTLLWNLAAIYDVIWHFVQKLKCFLDYLWRWICFASLCRL